MVYDAASNTRIVYRVVTPGELKKTPAPLQSNVSSSSPSSNIRPTSAAPLMRGRGKRGRPPRSGFVTPAIRKVEPDEASDSDGEDTVNVTHSDMSRVCKDILFDSIISHHYIKI